MTRKSHTDERSTWNAIAKEIKNRTGKQCRERWVNQLSMPERKKGNWTKAEDRIIADRQAEWGNTWSAIAGIMSSLKSYAVYLFLQPFLNSD